ncbi:DUF2812 domain-containing protein [Slackia heliotrinireducens]|uniref:DUF2812 domain-containing protein n=1 Tax=Slackia heliotrinireducens TaxID=84110 RepID=UPI003314CE12
MRTTVKKAFLDIQKEQEWLNEQGKDGRLLIGYDNGVYEFEDVAPAQFHYAVDLPKYSGSKRKEYLAFLEQSGITVVAEYADRVYLRKNAADGPLDLYTDKKDIERHLGKSYSHFFTIGAPQLALGSGMLAYTLHELSPINATDLFPIAVEVGLIISGTVFLILGVRKYREQRAAVRTDSLWE